MSYTAYPAPMHEWMPGAIFLVLHTIVFLTGILGYWS